MMKLFDLTMPIWEGAGYGEILPFTNSSVRFLEYMFYDKHGLRMTRMKLDGETGSPFMVPHQRNPFDPTPLQPDPKFSWTLDEIPLEKLVLRDTVVLDIRAPEGHEITPEEMEGAIKRADYQKGDEVLLRTGWGTRERAYELGIDYYKRTPSIHYDAAVILATKMDQMGSSLFMTDCGLVNPPRVQGNNWFRGEAPMAPHPKPWPSAANIMSTVATPPLRLWNSANRVRSKSVRASPEMTRNVSSSFPLASRTEPAVPRGASSTEYSMLSPSASPSPK
jgi:kynurenine formamidase